MSQRPADEQIKVRDGAAVWRQIEGETVLLALDSSMYLGLNRTATELWPLMIQGTTRGSLIDRLVSRFEIDAGQAAVDVDGFIDACRHQRLLVA